MFCRCRVMWLWIVLLVIRLSLVKFVISWSIDCILIFWKLSDNFLSVYWNFFLCLWFSLVLVMGLILIVNVWFVWYVMYLYLFVGVIVIWVLLDDELVLISFIGVVKLIIFKWCCRFFGSVMLLKMAIIFLFCLFKFIGVLGLFRVIIIWFLFWLSWWKLIFWMSFFVVEFLLVVDWGVIMVEEVEFLLLLMCIRRLLLEILVE